MRLANHKHRLAKLEAKRRPHQGHTLEVVERLPDGTEIPLWTVENSFAEFEKIVIIRDDPGDTWPDNLSKKTI